MFRKHHKKLNKRGFTLAESILALAVIAITSVGVLSLVLSSHRATTAAAQKQQAQLYAADIINCYRVSTDLTNFEENVKFALNQEDATNFDFNQITLNKQMNATVSIEENTVTVLVKDNNDKELTKLTFTKGGMS